MGKIKRAFLSNNYGSPLVQIGSGLVQDIKNNFSGSKKDERIVLNIEVSFDNGETNYIVIKIAPLTFKETSLYSKNYFNKLDTIKTPEKCLLNKYFHEAQIYNFFLSHNDDPIVNNFILKSLGSGVTRNGIIDIMRNDGKFEKVNIFDNSIIRTLILQNNWEEIPERGFIYITTEFNPESRSLADGLKFKIRTGPESKKKEKKKKLNINFVNTTIETLKYLNNIYKFSHWDFHAGNIRYCSVTGKVEIFDFDLSTIDSTIVKNSQYIHYIPFIYELIKNLQIKYRFLNVERGYFIAKNKLAHFYDIFQFVSYINWSKDLLHISNYKESYFIEKIINIEKRVVKYISSITDYLEDNIDILNNLSYGGSLARVWNFFKRQNSGHISKKIEDDVKTYIEIVINVIKRLQETPKWNYINRIFCAYLLLCNIEDNLGVNGPLFLGMQDIRIESEIEQEKKSKSSDDRLTIPKKIKAKVISKTNIGKIYKKKIQKCFKRPREGGYPIAELRNIASQIGVSSDKLTTRKVICTELYIILGVEKNKQNNQKQPKQKKILTCEDYITNRGKRCPQCCSHHKDKCKWVRGKGCKTKK